MVKSDVLVIGGGPGGYLAAERAAQGGKTVTLIEKRALGGTCLNEGCIPSKALLNSGKLYEHAKESEVFGVTAENVKIDHAKVVDRKDKVVKMLVSGVGATMKAHGVNVVMAEGVIKGKTADGFVVTARRTRKILLVYSNPRIRPRRYSLSFNYCFAASS